MKPYTPHPYQVRGMQLLCSEQAGAGLLFDPGLGKTSTVLGAFTRLKEEDPTLKMLVVAPIRPMYDAWPGEVLKWDDFKHLSVGILHGPKKKAVIQEDHDIYVVNPEGILWLFDEKQRTMRSGWSILCIDESTKFKSTTTRRFKVLKKHLSSFERRWILTGTVCPNGLLDLYGQVYVMDQGASLGAYITHFKNKFFYKVDPMGYTLVPHAHALDIVTDLISDKVIQLDAEDYLDMPEFLPVTRSIELPKEVSELYESLENDFLLRLDEGDVVAANTAVLGNKLRQIASGFLYGEDGQDIFLHSEKLKALGEIVEETNGHPLMILYEFKPEREALLDYFGDRAVCITGVFGAEFQSICARFNRGEIPYLIVNGASTHGMNVQGACHHLVWYGIPWNLESYIQSNYRLYRQGQLSRVVYAYHLVATDTMDETVMRALSKKDATQEQVNQALSGPNHELQNPNGILHSESTT